MMTDLDPLADPVPAAPAPAAPVHAGASPTKKVKVSSVTDQMDDSEIDLMTRLEFDQAHLWHIDMTGAEPSDDSEPTGEQITALRDRIVRRGESPYADFSILTPFGRTIQKQLKTRSWLLLQDGTFKALDIPGPPSFDAWQACWKVFRAILFIPRAFQGGDVSMPGGMLIAKLNQDFPETWHLIMKVEDKCQSEMFERYRRHLTKAATDNRLPMGLDFLPNQPWIGVFTYAAQNRELWDEHVFGPVTMFMARGGRNMTMDKAERVNIPGKRCSGPRGRWRWPQEEAQEVQEGGTGSDANRGGRRWLRTPAKVGQAVYHNGRGPRAVL